MIDRRSFLKACTALVPAIMLPSVRSAVPVSPPQFEEFFAAGYELIGEHVGICTKCEVRVYRYEDCDSFELFDIIRERFKVMLEINGFKWGGMGGKIVKQHLEVTQFPDQKYIGFELTTVRE